MKELVAIVGAALLIYGLVFMIAVLYDASQSDTRSPCVKDTCNGYGAEMLAF